MDIKVGMMVEIIDAADFTMGRGYIGHVGAITRRSINFGGNWFVDGAETYLDGSPFSFPERAIRPIKGDQETSSWKLVQEQTGWSPQKVAITEKQSKIPL